MNTATLNKELAIALKACINRLQWHRDNLTSFPLDVAAMERGKHVLAMMDEPANLRIYDNGGSTADRYTVIYLDQPESREGTFQSLGMSGDPFHPCGVATHGPAMPGHTHLGKRIRWDELPEACRQAVLQDRA